MLERHCETCGKAFLVRHRSRRFCSRSCQIKANNSRQLMRLAAEWRARRQAALMAAEEGTAGTICPSCGTMFAPLRSTGRYCSPKCKQRARRQRQRTIRQQTTCPTCSIMFVPIGRALYCSSKCKNRAYRERQRANPQAPGMGGAANEA
jgi:predicted nucleic acid-binding Zn ribbon protein